MKKVIKGVEITMPYYNNKTISFYLKINIDKREREEPNTLFKVKEV